MKKYKISWEEIYEKVKVLKSNLENKNDKIYGIPRGGQIVAGLTGLAVDTPEEANIIVDDFGAILISGKHFQNIVRALLF